MRLTVGDTGDDNGDTADAGDAANFVAEGICPGWSCPLVGTLDQSSDRRSINACIDFIVYGFGIQCCMPLSTEAVLFFSVELAEMAQIARGDIVAPAAASLAQNPGGFKA
jgi:hypothetical protein